MNCHVEVMRFHEGLPRQGQPPEAIVQQAPSEAPAEAGELLIVLVELSPPIHHRLREVRTVAAEVYWRSSGSVIARLRRALGEANRYLIGCNESAPPDEQSAGSITCAVIRGEELFIGQVGAANAFLQSPKGPVELFPRRSRLYPLGASLPPVINIGYAPLEAGSTLLIATSGIAEAQARSLWAETLSTQRATEQSLETIAVTMESSRASGALVFVRCEADETPEAESATKPRPRRRPRARPRPARKPMTISLPRPTVRLPRISRAGLRPVGKRLRGAITWMVAGIGAVRAWGTRLLPRPVEGGKRRPRPVPREHSLLMGSLTAGFLAIVAFITLMTYLQEGGPQRAATLLQEARAAQAEAYSLQTEEAWGHVVELCDHILALDPTNAEAAALRRQAQDALDALGQAALLQTRKLLTLGASRQVRHLLVIDHRLYLLDPDADTLIAYPLSEDGMSLAGDGPQIILGKGQTILGEEVGELVDMAWLEPTIGYKGGAIFVYGDGGILYTYEPDLGEESCTLTHLRGEPPQTAAVTAMDTFGDAFYLLDRHRNQILKYQPHNGTYDNPPRPYFAAEAAPPLAEVLDMAIDGRIYLLMGNGELQAYSEGVPDPSFQLQHDDEDAFHPTVMAMERDAEKGRFYLADPSSERIGVFDKRGRLLRRYRLEGEALRSVEAIAVSDDPYLLYLLMDNTIFVAPFPAFAPQGGP